MPSPYKPSKFGRARAGVHDYHAASLSDSADDNLEIPAVGLLLSAEGAITLVKIDDSEELIPSGMLKAGIPYDLPHKRIKDTGTDVAAAAILWLW